MPEKEEFKFSAKMIVVNSGESSVTAEMVAKVARNVGNKKSSRKR